MKAIILVAGAGTRLRPLTDRLPKCMVPLGGKPLVQHTVELCRHFGITEILMNPCHLPHVITDYFGDGSRFGVRIQYLPETSPLGTAGTVKQAARHFDEPFLVWYGDNVSRCNLGRLRSLHQTAGAQATIALLHRQEVSQSGIVGLDPNHRITRFLEKPKPEEAFSNWVNGGIYMLEPAILDAIPADGPSDFGRDVFPMLLARGVPLFGYCLSPAEGLWWIDRPEDLARVEQDFPSTPQDADCPDPVIGDRGFSLRSLILS